ncbi:group I truncated hemoglobin [Nocardioides sp. URHA0020]|uniref:group I truncated hemoglobin n=1 Tax=Nocardioides sp. URHA0020 TaxID=1380392 RepID=UPI0004901CF7|nr:group 1 truncated hemoglobin [Nocardioides sp. URHA0020]
MNTRTMLLELGGPEGVAATVDELYRRLLHDPEIAPYFVGVDVAAIRIHMTDFLVAVVDGPDHYAGRDLASAHGRLHITDAAFDATASHLLDTLEDRAVRPDLLDAVLDRIAPLRASIVTAR